MHIEGHIGGGLAIWALLSFAIEGTLLWIALPVVLLLSVAPDIDVWTDRLDHRQQTHSIVIFTIVAYITQAIVSQIFGYSSEVFAIVFLPLLTHSLLDLFNYQKVGLVWPEGKWKGWSFDLFPASHKHANQALLVIGTIVATVVVTTQLA